MRILQALMMVALLAGCGYRGPLYLPGQEPVKKRRAPPAAPAPRPVDAAKSAPASQAPAPEAR